MRQKLVGRLLCISFWIQERDSTKRVESGPNATKSESSVNIEKTNEIVFFVSYRKLFPVVLVCTRTDGESSHKKNATIVGNVGCWLSQWLALCSIQKIIILFIWPRAGWAPRRGGRKWQKNLTTVALLHWINETILATLSFWRICFRVFVVCELETRINWLRRTVTMIRKKAVILTNECFDYNCSSGLPLITAIPKSRMSCSFSRETLNFIISKIYHLTRINE